MKNSLLLLFTFFFCFATAQNKKYVLIIHGGAGYINSKTMSPELSNAYKAKLTEALKAGYSQLQNGKPSVEAVQSAIIVMENSELFNAGKGAVFTHEGKNELDASIMDGKTMNAGAIAGVSTVKNPIKLAATVMYNSPHVMLAREGAEKFAEKQGLDIVHPKYFYSEGSYQELQRALKDEKNHAKLDKDYPDWKFGTVGAVALDQHGNLAAGTSTGGMTNKRWARIGDSPIIGAGTYATNEVGVSCTGWGEYYIRANAAADLAARMKYANKNIYEAAKEVIQNIGYLGGEGGIIALDKYGNATAEFDTPGMFRAMITQEGEIEVIF